MTSLRFIQIAITSFLIAVSLLSCSTNKESDDLASAQACLDKVPQSSPSSADECLQYVEKYSSQQANILKCSIYMTSGGLVENKILKAYNALKDATLTNKEAAFMAVLSLDNPDVNSGYTKAVAADTYCQASGITGLQYISGVIVAGTYMAKIMGGVDVNDTAALETKVNAMLAKCAPTPPTAVDASCTADIATLGSTITTLGTTYCSKADSDTTVCTQVNTAISNAAGDTTDVGLALFCLLNKKTYTASNNTCT